MRHSSVIKKDIEKVEKDKKKLKKLSQAASGVKSSISSVAGEFIKAGAAIEGAGDIGGTPFDNGKTKEQGEKFKRISENLGDAITMVNKEVQNLEDDLIDLNDELVKALAAEAEAARKKKQQNNSTEETV